MEFHGHLDVFEFEVAVVGVGGVVIVCTIADLASCVGDACVYLLG